jgi:hypothetical protein
MSTRVASGIKILLKSADIRKAIRRTLIRPKSDRRVFVAYVGKGAEALIPNPKGLKLYCRLQAPGTHPDALRALMAAGVEVHESRTLHMKIYWSSSRGTVVGSANLSRPGLMGISAEAAVLLPPNAIKPREVIGMLGKLSKVSSKRVDQYEEEYRRVVQTHGTLPETPIEKSLKKRGVTETLKADPFKGKTVVVTGKFRDTSTGERRTQGYWQRRIGGLPRDSITNQTDYLVIGLDKSPHYLYGKYGTKIAEAQQMKKRTGRPAIITERDIWMYLGIESDYG